MHPFPEPAFYKASTAGRKSGSRLGNILPWQRNARMGAGGPIRRSIVKNSDAYSQAGKRQVALIGAGDRIVAGVHPEGEPRIDPVDLIDVDSHQIVGPDLVAPGAFD